MLSSREPMAHACHPSYSGGRDMEDRDSKPVQENRSQDPISKKPFTEKGWLEWPWIQNPVLQNKQTNKKCFLRGVSDKFWN
jgi:hypothetical protein